MRVELLGLTAVRDGGRVVAGHDLGGRRARVLLAALALAEGPCTAHSLAGMLWGEQLPATWQVSLRGAVRSLRLALAPVGGDGSAVIGTAPSGYVLADGVEVDVRLAARRLPEAAQLLTAGRHRAALEAAEPFIDARGADVLPGEDAEWLAVHRAAIDSLAADALDIVAEAASALDEHPRAIDVARRAVSRAPLDERAHRSLITVLSRAGDRAGAVLAYEQCRSTLADELGLDPSAETVTTYLEATSGQARTAVARVPAGSGAFVGRGRDAQQLTSALSRPGLVTLVGRGGVGKSRLAAEVAAARQTVDHFTGGRFWVPLTGLAEDGLVGVSVALALDVNGGSDPAAALITHLAPLGRALLVLDGGDAVVDGAATVAVALVEACPMLTVLVSSRTALDVDGEHVMIVGALATPDERDVSDAAPVQLVLDRLPAGTLDLDDPAVVTALVELCRRCDGLPLALELAAAQLGDMCLPDLLDQLDASRPDRLRAIAASVHAQLGADEAAVFRRFAVLDGPVTLGIARGVLAGDGIAPERVVRLLGELAARGLVGVDRGGPRWTYSQDDDVHRFATELLDASPERTSTYTRLYGAMLGLLPADSGAPPAAFAEAVTAVLPSIRSAFAAALAGRADTDPALELAFRLHRYWAATSVAEGRLWLERLLAVAGESPWRRYATFALGYLSYWAGDTDAALRDLSATVELFSDEPDPFVARALIFSAGLLDDMDRPAEALAYLRRAITAAEPFGPNLYVSAAMGLGSVLSERADPEAVTHAEAAVARCRAEGSVEQLSMLLPTAAMIAWQAGALDEARAYLAEAWPMHADQRRIARVVLLSAATGVALSDGDVEAAVDHGRTAAAEGAELGVDREMPLILALLARALLARGDIADAAERALAGIDAAAAMTVAFPMAIGLESAALIGDHTGAAQADIAALLGTAAGIRAAGDRPAAPSLRAVLERLPVGAAVPVEDAVELARQVLTTARGRR